MALIELLTAYLAIGHCFFGLAAFTSVLRLYSRAFVFRQMRVDDTLMLIGMALLIPFIALSHVVTREFQAVLKGFPDSDAKFPPTHPLFPRAQMGLRCQYVGGVIHPSAVGAVKLAWLAFFYRILPKKSYHVILHTLTTIIVVFTIGISLLAAFACMPVRVRWSMLPGQCHLNPIRVHVANGIFNAITDVVLLFLPVPTVVGLHASFRKKAALLAIFSLGVVGTVVTIIRMPTLIQTAHSDQQMIQDRFKLILLSFLYAGLEVSIFVICGNIPAVYALWRGPDGVSSTSAPRQPSAAYDEVRDHTKNPRRGRRTHASRLGSTKHTVPSAATAAVAATTTADGSSAEHIITPPPDAIHLSTRMVVDVESQKDHDRRGIFP